MTNYERVFEWMTQIGQSTHNFPKMPARELVQFRKMLIQEEFEEVLVELDIMGKATPITPDNMVDLAKELSDLLVVVYGTYAALGINANAVFDKVMKGNVAKNEKGVANSAGKFVVPPHEKERINTKTTKSVKECLYPTF